MKISNLSIKRPVTTTMMVLLIVILGAISLTRINLDLFPNLNFPVAVVTTDYAGVGPQEVENMVTKPMEGSLSTVTNIKNITSQSSAGSSVVIAEFNWGTDMDFATLDMREKTDMIEGLLPEDVGEPRIFTFDPSMMPILQIGVTGEEDLVALKRTVEDDIIPRLERLKGVASVQLTGGLNREIVVEINQSKLNNYGLSLSTITQTLMMENVDISGGQIERGQRQLLVRTKGKFKSLDQIRKVQIQTGRGFISLDDIAEIKDTYKQISNMARMNGKPSIGLTIQKQTNANTVQVSDMVKEELEDIKGELGSEYSIKYMMDQAKFIEQSIGNVQKNAIFGAVLAAIVLLVFLRNIRSTLIIATAIPVSVITTFTLIYFGGLTLNMMTLGGLALGIGMLVDNAIVVLENIYRLRKDGYGLKEAARMGSNQVGMAIVASTLTTAIVFLPVVFVRGIASELFKELALTITFSLVASLLVALTFIPMLSSKILKLSRKDKYGDEEDNDKRRDSKILNMYRSSLDWALSHRLLIIIVLLVLLGSSGFLARQIGSEFIPSMDQGEFTVTAELPHGTLLEKTNEVIEEVEDEILEIPEVKTIFTNVGSTGDALGGNNSEVGQVMVRLTDLDKRDRTTKEVMEEVRNKLKIPDTDISIEAQDAMGGGMAGGPPITIQVKGSDLTVLENKAQEIKSQMEQVTGVREVEDSLSNGRPEMQIEIDRTMAAKFGLRVTQVGSIVKTAIKGSIATRYEVGGQEYDVRVRLNEEDRNSISNIKQLLIPSPVGAKVPLNRIATFEIDQGPQMITRDNQERYVEITADIYKADLGTVMEQIKDRINNNVEIPDNYNVIYGGQFEEMMDSFRDLGFAFLLAIVLVYMVMASQFESLLHPFVIMFTVPMAAIGIFYGLYMTGHNFSVPSIIGIIMLAGIVVNNAIVLVDYINNRRGEDRTVREAILEAAPIRLRPIMMTALTTILGLLPLALGIGEGSEVQAPMAVVVIGGLSCATLLTLYVVPVLYSLFEGMKMRLTGAHRQEYENPEIYS